MKKDPSERKGEPEETQKVCFVISPIGDEGSEIRNRSDKVLQHVFKTALEPLGYAVIRSDEFARPGLITMQILEHIMNDDLVLADLTDHNPNMFYELAVRHAVEKPVIHTIDTRVAIPFDVSDFRTVKFDFRDLDSVAQARNEIQKQAREIEDGNVGQTPIKLASVVQKLGASQSGENFVVRQILDTLLQVRADVSELKKEMEVTRISSWADASARRWSVVPRTFKQMAFGGGTIFETPPPFPEVIRHPEEQGKRASKEDHKEKKEPTD